MCMAPDNMTIDQLAALEVAYRNKGWDDYADQIKELHEDRVASGWTVDFVPEVTPRWTQYVQAAQFSKGSEDEAEARFWNNPAKFVGYAKEKAAQEAEFKKHLSHI